MIWPLSLIHISFNAKYIKATADTKAAWEITATVVKGGDTRTFVGRIDESSTAANSVLLKESPVKPGEESGQYIDCLLYTSRRKRRGQKYADGYDCQKREGGCERDRPGGGTKPRSGGIH